MAMGGAARAADKAMSPMHGAKAMAAAAVTISNYKFTHGAPGSSRRNGDVDQREAPHTTTSDTKAWDSGKLAKGATFSHKFMTPGSFAYHCSIHPDMKGTINVGVGEMKKKSHM